MQRSFSSSGIASSDRTSGTSLMYRGSCETSGTSTGFLVQRGVADEAFAERHARHLDLLAVLAPRAYLELVVAR